MKIIKFSHDYSKLNYHLFTTIRRYDRYTVGEILTAESPSKTFESRIILKIKMKLSDIPTHFLCFDTDTMNRDEAIETLDSFYNKTIHSEERLTLLLLEKYYGDF